MKSSDLFEENYQLPGEERSPIWEDLHDFFSDNEEDLELY